MTMIWISNAGFTGCLRGLAPAVLFLLTLVACDEVPKVKLYVYQEAGGTNTLFVNDQPFVPKGNSESNVYVVESREVPFHLEIKADGRTIYKENLLRGSYAVNLSSKHLIWFAEIAYGRQLGPDARHLERGKLGAHWLGPKIHYKTWDFDEEPPESIRSRRGSASRGEYFIMGTYTEKGIALRRKLAAQSEEKRKAAAPFRELTQEEKDRIFDALKGKSIEVK